MKKELYFRNLANFGKNASNSIVKAGEESEKRRVLEMIPKRCRNAHDCRLIHIHDLEFYDITYNCIGLNVADLIGFGLMSFKGAVRKISRKITELTNMQSGGIGFLDFDTDMAFYVKDETIEELSLEFRDLFLDLNTFSRKGCEKPYVTFNFGIGDFDNARKVSYAILRAYEMGDEDGKPFVFPNLVFKLKQSVNVKTGSPNYDLYLHSLESTSKRMVPTYFNCDSQINIDANPKKIGIMGCRTRVVDNLYGDKSGIKRGNIACVTINLVQIAYKTKGNLDEFRKQIISTLEDARDSLIHRYNTLIENRRCEDILKLNIYKDSESKDIKLTLRNGTLSIGFIGLWDALAVVYKKEWGSILEMKPYLEIAVDIVKMMKKQVDDYKNNTKLNFSLLASAAEGVTGRFAEYDLNNIGHGALAAKKGYYTNSFHLPVNINADYIEKIQFEGIFHCLCNGGSITYIELEESPAGNTEAIKEIVEYAYNNDCNYIGVNFPLDDCQDCGYIGKISKKCPCCKNDNIRRLRRVSGYLAEVDRFVDGKRFELIDRVAHIK